EILRKATEEEILRERALAREKFLRDKLHMENRYNRGLEEGREIGREEGRMTERRELAKNFRNSGIPIDVIAKNTGLTIEEIEKL
ncbi:MAG: transposase, partial [Firmicutes bacterium]|nr:transposase [Bacillota bacterium]